METQVSHYHRCFSRAAAPPANIVRLSLRLIIAIAAGWLWPSSQPLAAKECADLESQTLPSISEYVHGYAKLPEDVQLIASDRGLMPGTCFHKIRITSASKGYVFAETLFLAPDHSYLTSDVLDLTVNPLVAEKESRNKLQADLSSGDRPYLGKKDAGSIIVVFSDFECPYCKQLAPILKKLLADRRDTKLMFRYFPLSSHAWARDAAEIAACVYAQGNDLFWEFHDQLFSSQTLIMPEGAAQSVSTIAKALPGIDAANLSQCINSHQMAPTVESDVQLGLDDGVNATPTLFVNGFIMPGVRSLDELESMVDSTQNLRPPPPNITRDDK